MALPGAARAVLAGCRKREPYQKVVVLTNYATDEIRRRAMDLGADAVFDKSSELDGLFAYCAEQTAQEVKPANQQAQRAAVARNREAHAAQMRRTPSGS
jgi:two-component system OmpR family response regulator